MFKTLKVLLLSIGLLLIFSFSHGSVEKSNTDSIISYAKNVEEGKYDNYNVYKATNTTRDSTEVETTLFWSKENISGYNYDWRWIIRVLKVHYYKAYGVVELEMVVRYYQDFTTIKSRGFEQWMLVDTNLDGKINVVRRKYVIVACEDHDCVDNYIIQPYYPKGLINKDWFNPSKEESNKIYDKEINYWMKTIWGEK